MQDIGIYYDLRRLQELSELEPPFDIIKYFLMFLRSLIQIIQKDVIFMFISLLVVSIESLL